MTADSVLESAIDIIFPGKKLQMVQALKKLPHMFNAAQVVAENVIGCRTRRRLDR